jgi:Ice-binding-like/Bacterial Ig-like domain
MNRFDNFTGGTTSHSTRLPNDCNQVAGYKPLMWLMALLLAAVVAGCGNGDPILGGSGTGKGTVPTTIVDTTRPRVTVTVPANAASSVPANTKITATFSEAMDSATINTGSFTLFDTTASAVVAASAVKYVSTSSTAVFTPASGLVPTNTYRATITTAATDVAGNALAGISATPNLAKNHVWTFTAALADIIPPTITLTSPASGVTNVATNATVNATFSEAMDPATINSATFSVAQSGVPSIAGTYTYDTTSNVATFTPAINLAPSTTYIATITPGATDLAGNALNTIGGKPDPWTFTTGNGLAPGAVALGSASTFGLMATSAITAATASVINGDVSLEPGTSITGFPPAVINGAVHINDTVSHQARNDLLTAYNYAKGLPCKTVVGTGGLGTAPSPFVYPTGIPPGVYCSGSTINVDVAAPIVLDGRGDTNAVWVFQAGSSITLNANVTLRNGAQAKNVFWVPTSDMTIGSGTTFNGTIVAGRDTTSAGFATINGRILTGAITAGTIALNGSPSTVNVPAP